MHIIHKQLLTSTLIEVDLTNSLVCVISAQTALGWMPFLAPSLAKKLTKSLLRLVIIPTTAIESSKRPKGPNRNSGIKSMGDIAYKASNRIIFDFPDPRINENPSIVKSLGISRMRLPIYKIDLRI